MMAATITNPFMAEYARIKNKQIAEIEASLAQESRDHDENEEPTPRS
jgi:hypothetical protein